MEYKNISNKIEILQFLFELGATEAHECEPINRLRISEEEEKINNGGDLEQETDKLVSPSNVNLQKRTFAELIENATNVNELISISAHCNDFSSSQLSDKMNFSFGNHLAKVMIICEPPGRREISENVIYSGDRGLIFQKMYDAIGLSVKGDNLYVVPIFPWRLSPNFDSAKNDIRKFFCCIKKHISIVKPKVLVLMHNESIDPENTSIDNKKFNKEYGFQDEHTVFRVETPARILESPHEKRAAWETLKNIREILKKNNE